jgi:conjugative transfer pilus assembly protein TraH
MNKLILMLSFCVSLALSKPVLASDIRDRMDEFFNQFEVQSNTTKADIVNGQLVGHATGGGVVIKNSIGNVKLVNMNLPHLEAGCGGIDLYAGGISFISSDRLVEVLKKIGTNSVGYATLLAMETLSPQSSNLIKQLQSWSNEINMAAINSCETASLLVGGLVPKGAEVSQHICRNLGSSSGVFSDYVSSRHQCGVESVKDERINDFKSKYPDVLVEEYNLAWEATHKLAIKKVDPELGKLLMSLVGTAIIKKEEGAVIVKTYPPQLANENFFRAIIQGGTPKILQCVSKNGKFLNDQCLEVEEVDYEIAYEDSWKGRIFQRLSDIQNKMNEDEPLSREEIDFVALCDAPVLRFLIVTNAKREGMNLVEISQLSDWVAQDLLCKSLREVINNIRAYAFQLKTSKYYADIDLDSYLTQLNDLFQIINQYEAKNANSMHRHLKLDALLDVIEEKMRSEILL